jgi:hypothetical protein
MATADKSAVAAFKGIEIRIFLMRGVRVMLDSDLAVIYGVPLKRLNEQVRRNAGRFPGDFAFQLEPQEFAILKSQIATSRAAAHGGKRKLPWVFTEHGALMLGNVLKSDRAARMSVFVVRAFVRMRELLASNDKLSGRINELEERVGGHDSAIAELIEAIRQLIEPPVEKRSQEIGFHVRETAPRYRIRTKKRF